MKIALVSNTAWSLVNFRAGLISGLRANRHEVVALAPPDDAVDRLRALGARYQPYWLDNDGINPARDLRTVAILMRLFGQLAPDLAILYTAKPIVYASLACRRRRIPYIAVVTGLGSAYLRGGWLARLLEFLYRVSLRGARRVYFCNADDMEVFLRKRLAPADRVRLLPGEGIDLAFFAPRPLPADSAPMHFLYFGRLLRDKGVVEFVEAARAVKARHGAVRFSLLGFAGARNPSAIGHEQVQAWVREGVVSYLGSTSDVRGHLEQANCIVLPSYREGSPRVLMEALAMARPVIATDVAGCRDLVTHGENGLLCAPRDAADLARAMERFIAMTPQERAAMGAHGRRRIEREYGDSLVLSHFLEAIDTIGQPA